MTHVLFISAVINVIAFFAFGLDKRRARLGKRRTAEATLLLLVWLTGFVGGWAGMKVFRHKTKKISFRLKMVLLTVLNLAWPLLWLHFR